MYIVTLYGIGGCGLIRERCSTIEQVRAYIASDIVPTMDDGDTLTITTGDEDE